MLAEFAQVIVGWEADDMLALRRRAEEGNRIAVRLAGEEFITADRALRVLEARLKELVMKSSDVDYGRVARARDNAVSLEQSLTARGVSLETARRAAGEYLIAQSEKVSGEAREFLAELGKRRMK